MVLIASRKRCEEKITDVGEDGKLVERFFATMESSTIPETTFFYGKKRRIVAREAFNRVVADSRDLVERMMLMRLATSGATRDLEKKVDRMEYRLERRIISPEASVQDIKG
ncbi:unnamed protein product [Haemonchus placei]|uniref:Transposase n=1 Tax=Haemonchus placei TaxID=6290 RepID=A0A0N4WJG2_HAEPC|nr:unnamed protein product [Haemonchus placei]